MTKEKKKEILKKRGMEELIGLIAVADTILSFMRHKGNEPDTEIAADTALMEEVLKDNFNIIVIRKENGDLQGFKEEVTEPAKEPVDFGNRTINDILNAPMPTDMPTHDTPGYLPK